MPGIARQFSGRVRANIQANDRVRCFSCRSAVLAECQQLGRFSPFISIFADLPS